MQNQKKQDEFNYLGIPSLGLPSLSGMGLPSLVQSRPEPSRTGPIEIGIPSMSTPPQMSASDTPQADSVEDEDGMGGMGGMDFVPGLPTKTKKKFNRLEDGY
jgi:hypothetical protein